MAEFEMTRARRAVLFVGMLVALVVVGRLLMPFRTGVGTGRGGGATSCGVVAAEARRGAPSSSATIVLTPLGEKQKAAAEPAAAVVDPTNSLGVFAHTGTDFFAADARFDHYTITHLSACTVAARRRVTSAGVLVGLDVIGVAGGLLILRPEVPRSR